LGEYPCAEPSKCIEHLKDSAEWVIEARISSIESTGKQTECESIDGAQHCSSIDSPELIKLSDVQVKRGDFQMEAGKSATISRKDICFSGPLSQVMNDRPELKMAGGRVRFFGDNRNVPPFVRSGFYYVEPTQ
jgi:hypothetical protein